MKRGLEYYAYLSEQTIHKLFDQISYKKFFPLEIGLNIPFLSIKASSSKREIPIIEKLDKVISYLERHNVNEIGTIDNPKKYIKGKIPMFQQYLPQGFGVGKDYNPELIYYGGSTQNTIIGLGGAASYVLKSSAGEMSQVSSSLPYLVGILAKEYRIAIAHPRFQRVNCDNQQAIDCMEYLEDYNRQDSPMQELSFFAKVKLVKKTHRPWIGDRNVLLASPIYVAYEE